MNLHEYQAKQFLAQYGLPISPGILCYTPGEAEAAADTMGGDLYVVKAQVHAGGRGKAGGVKLARSALEARTQAEKILGMKLVTPQTGEAGKLVRKIYVEKGSNISKELYLSLVVDRASRSIAFIASTEGGMDIEEVSEKHPEKIVTIAVDPKVGLQTFQAVELGLKLQIPPALTKDFIKLAGQLYKAFIAGDMAMLEINPLIITTDGKLIVLDAKVSIDDNALFRQPALRAMMDYDEIDPKDLRAMKSNLNFVALEGSIACLVNGAGLAMATMDIIKMAGGSPANFLDVGGGASKEMVTEAFRLLLSDGQVKGILVNIFGGIMKCDIIAQGIIEATRELEVKVPLVVRLQGTNVQEGKKLLAESGLKITPADTMDDAANKIVAAVKAAG